MTIEELPVELAKLWGNNEVVSCFSQQLAVACPDTATNVTTSVQHHTVNIRASITDVTVLSLSDVTISDVHSRQQHERKRVSVHNTVKQRHNTYV
jgi:hypothetical protein